MPGLLAQNRRRFLNAALEDTLRWCARPDATVIGNHPTDQYWIQTFAATAPPTDAHTARFFLGTFKLAGDWDYDAVAGLINDLRQTTACRPERDVAALAQALRQTQDRDIECTAAASKLAQVVFPAADVHVWHDLAWHSVRSHDPRSRSDAVPNDSREAGAPDYAAYHAGCRRILAREMVRTDFTEAAALLTGLLRAIPGPLAHRAVPDSFFQRYLLDKLLFHQGWHTKYGRVARSEAFETTQVSDPLRPGLYQRLRNYIKLGGTEVIA